MAVTYYIAKGLFTQNQIDLLSLKFWYAMINNIQHQESAHWVIPLVILHVDSQQPWRFSNYHNRVEQRTGMIRFVNSGSFRLYQLGFWRDGLVAWLRYCNSFKYPHSSTLLLCTMDLVAHSVSLNVHPCLVYPERRAKHRAICVCPHIRWLRCVIGRLQHNKRWLL